MTLAQLCWLPKKLLTSARRCDTMDSGGERDGDYSLRQQISALPTDAISRLHADSFGAGLKYFVRRQL